MTDFTRLKKLLLFILIPFVLLLGIRFLYNTFWFGTVTIESSQRFVSIKINDETYSGAYLAGEKLKVRPGEITVEGFGPKIKEVRTTASVGVLSNETITLPYEEINETELFGSLIGELPSNYKISVTELFEGDTWLVIGVLGDGTTDGFISIYKYENSEWQIVESGTGLDRAYLLSRGVPESVITFIEGLDE